MRALIAALRDVETRLAQADKLAGALRGLIYEHNCWCSYYDEYDGDIDERDHEIACKAARAALDEWEKDA